MAMRSKVSVCSISTANFASVYVADGMNIRLLRTLFVV
jgi:hypothetical protein